MNGRLQGGSIFANNKVQFRVIWDNGSVGQYTGTIDDNGRLSGYTLDLNKPGSGRVGFFSTTGFICRRR